jgi:hypothetical protein
MPAIALFITPAVSLRRKPTKKPAVAGFFHAGHRVLTLIDKTSLLRLDSSAR